MIVYDITSDDRLEYGYEYDSLTDRITFAGFAKSSEENLLYLIFNNGNKYMIPLAGSVVDVGSPLTDKGGHAKGQLVEMSTDGEFVRNSQVFKIYVKRSLPRSAVSDISNTAIRTLYGQIYEMYSEIIEESDNFVTRDEVGEVVDEYIEEHPIEAPVTSVNTKTGAVVLSASDVGALPSNTPIPSKTSDLTNDSGFLSTAVTSFNGQTGVVTYTAPVTSVNGMTGDVVVQGGGGEVDSVNGQTGTVILDADDVGALPDTTVIPSKTSDLANDSGFITSVPVSSVNSKTGAVVLTASDVNALPSNTVIPTKTSDLTNDSGFITSVPVSSVNSKTGAVVLNASDVGALPSSTSIPSKTSDLTNDSGFLTSAVTSFNGNTGAVTYTAPVTSVNGSTGAVVIGTATTSANGLMSSTDKSHLDAVYADYSSALTALGV